MNATNSTRAVPVEAATADVPPFKQAAGLLIFIFIWVLLLRDRWSWLPLGRAASALLGACLMVAFGVFSPSQAFSAINLPTLALLFGCMLIGAHMERQGLYAALTNSLSSPSTSPKSLLIRVCAVSAVASALLTNDTVCVILTPMVLRTCLARARPLNPVPFALAVATSANIGSACSPIGNPQNMIIALLGGVYFTQFLGAIAIASVGGLVINTAMIAWAYREDLADDGRVYQPTDAQRVAVGLGPAVADRGDDAASARTASAAPYWQADQPSTPIDSATKGRGNNDEGDAVRLVVHDSMAGPTDRLDMTVGQQASGTAVVEPTKDGAAQASGNAPVAAAPDFTLRTSPVLDWDSGQPVVSSTTAPEVGLTSPDRPTTAMDTQARATTPAKDESAAAGHHASPGTVPGPRRSAIRFLLAALPLLLLVADRWIGLGWMTCLVAIVLTVLDGSQPEPLLATVDAALLLFFSGLFVVVDGFNSTGLPEQAWEGMGGVVSVNTTAGLLAFSVLVLIGSNTVSNVPLVLLLAPKVTAMGPDAPVAWLFLAWSSTVAGNLTLLGSVANLIVAERCKDVTPLTFGEYTKVGAPSTLLLTALGVPLVVALARQVS